MAENKIDRQNGRAEAESCAGGLRLGCIADDFTGAGDAASFLADHGMRTLLLIGPVEGDVDIQGFDAVVIALKSRSEERSKAAAESLQAIRWLRQRNARKLYVKYCSTFDSTREGNIGPICDAILSETGQSYTILCPSLPANGRIVEDGILYVNGVPLAESHMKNHPLNPMWSSKIAELMKPQSSWPVFVVRREEFAEEDVLRRKIESLKSAHEHFYLLPDFVDDVDGRQIVSFFREIPVWTGGSELLAHFAEAEKTRKENSVSRRGRLMICGSCSDMTQKQVKMWVQSGGKAYMVTDDDVLDPERRIPAAAEYYLEDPSQDVLFYSSGSAGLRKADHSVELSGSIEQFMAGLAAEITNRACVDRLIVAGGETSGAVTLALALQAFDIGPSIAPGVPILRPTERPGMQLVLKSGNFGEEDFFLKTLV